MLIAALMIMIYKSIRELSFLMLGTGAEEFLEGYQSFLPGDIALSNFLSIISAFSLFLWLLYYLFLHTYIAF